MFNALLMVQLVFPLMMHVQDTQHNLLDQDNQLTVLLYNKLMAQNAYGLMEECAPQKLVLNCQDQELMLPHVQLMQQVVNIMETHA